MRRSITRAFVVLFMATTAIGLAPSASGAQATGSVRVVHGLRGVVADVYLDGALVLETFEPERTTEPLSLPAGPHQVDVRLAGSAPDSAPAVSGTLDVPAGGTVSAVVHLSGTSTPTMTVFTDEATPLAAGQTRVVVRHVAAAPAIDVRLNQQVVASNLANTGQAATDVAAATYEVSVATAGTPETITPAQNVPLTEGTANTMYLIGDQASATLAWIAVQQTGLQTPPAAVQTGNSEVAARDGGGLRSVWIAAFIAAAGVGAYTLTRRRRLTVE
jgi:hypothetical protein